jgi:hypothetical protein
VGNADCKQNLPVILQKILRSVAPSIQSEVESAVWIVRISHKARYRIRIAVYDSVGLVKAFFTALGRKKCAGKRRRVEAGVKGAYFAFISTLDTGLHTSTIGLVRISGSF